MLALAERLARWHKRRRHEETMRVVRERIGAEVQRIGAEVQRRRSTPPRHNMPDESCQVPRSRLELIAALSDLRAEAHAAGQEDIAMELHKLLMFRIGPPPAVVVR